MTNTNACDRIYSVLEKYMEEEILKLIYNYSVNKKYADQEFYDTILVLFLKHHKVNNYINTIIINNNITDLGIYDNKRKTC